MHTLPEPGPGCLPAPSAYGWGQSSLWVPSRHQRRGGTWTRCWEGDGGTRFLLQVMANLWRLQEEQSWEEPAAGTSCRNASGCCYQLGSASPISTLPGFQPNSSLWSMLASTQLHVITGVLSAGVFLSVYFFITLIRNPNSHWNTESRPDHIYVNITAPRTSKGEPYCPQSRYCVLFS